MLANESKVAREDPHDRVPITRLQILADVIFAASMVFMASAFELPDTDIVDSPGELTGFLKSQLPVVAIYVISFILVAVYWMKHLEHCSYLQKTNIGHLWLQILFLAMVVIIPYSNALSSAAPDTLASDTGAADRGGKDLGSPDTGTTVIPDTGNVPANDGQPDSAVETPEPDSGCSCGMVAGGTGITPLALLLLVLARRRRRS